MKIKITGRDNLVVQLSGSLNESSELEMLALPKADSIEIDLVDLKLINSVGIRSFKNWIFSIDFPVLTLSYCPKVFIDQVNMVVDFMPKHARIMSFYVPYFNEDSGEEKLVLFVRGENFKLDGGKLVLTPPQVQDSRGRDMEIDVVVDRYFSFLYKY